jgi:desulfoferrodoxin (superoxide reductase-like protein)
MFKNMFLKINIIFFCLFLLILTTNNVIAHPPSKLNIEYIEENEVVFVNITHSVSNNDHYIKAVEIHINDKIYGVYNYTNQPSETTFSYKYNTSTNDGDTIKVKAICNQFGTLTRELVVGENNNSSPTPGFMSASLFISMLMLFFLYKRRLN